MHPVPPSGSQNALLPARPLRYRDRLKHQLFNLYLMSPPGKARKQASLTRRYCRPCVENRLAASLRSKRGGELKKLESTPLPPSQFESSFLFAPDGHFLRDESLAYSVDMPYDPNGKQEATRERIIAKDSGIQFDRRSRPNGGKIMYLTSTGQVNRFKTPPVIPMHLAVTWETDKPDSLQVSTSWASERIPMSREDYVRVSRRLLALPRAVLGWLTAPLAPPKRPPSS